MTCRAADGQCEKPVLALGLCAGHYKRARRRSRLALALPIQARARTAFEGVLIASVAYRDELETKTDEEHQLGLERIRGALRRYFWELVPKTLRRATFSSDPAVQALVWFHVERWLMTDFGDKSGHGKSPTHNAVPPTQFKRRAR